MSCRARWCLAWLLVLLLPCLSFAQTAPINSNVVIFGHVNFCASATASGTAYACALGVSPGTYTTGTRYSFKADVANTGAATINFSSLGAKSIVKVQGSITTPLVADDIRAGQMVDLVYDGTNMQMVSPTGHGFPAVTSVYLPAGALEVEGACALATSGALVTNGPRLPTIVCTDTDTDGIGFDLVMPDGWDGGTITVELIAFSAANNNGEVLALNFSGQCVRDTDAIAAFAVTSGATATGTTNRTATITWGNSTNREQHATTAALTLSGTCAGGAHVYGHGLVNATATTLTPMSDGKILGLKLELTRSSND